MTDDTAPSQKSTWIIAVVAIACAAAPYAFFAPPLQLHMEGEKDAWIGIAVWAPAILASVAFFFGVEFGQRKAALDERLSPAVRTAIIMVGSVAFLLASAMVTERLWTDMASMRPWGELKIALPLFAGLGALRTVFWQGFVQDRLFSNSAIAFSVAAVATLELLVVLPFFAAGNFDSVALVLVPLVLLEAILAASAYEVGLSVRSVMLLRAVAGVGFVWFQQALLL